MKKIPLILLMTVLIADGILALQNIDPTHFNWVKDTIYETAEGQKTYDEEYSSGRTLTDDPQIVGISIRATYTDWGRQYYHKSKDVAYDIFLVDVNLPTGTYMIYLIQSYDFNNNKISSSIPGYEWIIPAPGSVHEHWVNLARQLPNNTQD
jgi:hypothetical protein